MNLEKTGFTFACFCFGIAMLYIVWEGHSKSLPYQRVEEIRSTYQVQITTLETELSSTKRKLDDFIYTMAKQRRWHR